MMARAVGVGIFAATAVMLWAAHGYAQNSSCLRIGSTFSDKHAVDRRVEKNVRDVLATLNLCMDIVSGPPRRLTEELNRGAIDGELFRVREYERAVAEAAMTVEEPLSEVFGYLVAAADVDLSARLKSTLTIGTLRGLRWHSAAAEGAAEIVVANDMEQLLTLLRVGRVDGILVGGFLREEFPELSNLPARVVYRSTAHFILHRSKSALAPVIASAIREFKQKGCSFILAAGGPLCADTGDLEPPFQNHRSAQWGEGQGPLNFGS